MALTAQLNAITQTYISPKIADNIFTGYPVLEKLTKNLNVPQDGGSTIYQPIMHAKQTAVGKYSGFDTLMTDATEVATNVNFDWAHYYSNMSVSKTDKLLNSGKSQVISLLATQADSAIGSLRDTMTTDLYATSAVTGGIQGLPLLCHTTTDFGGICSTDLAGWAASVDSSTTVLSIGSLINKFADCTYGSDVPVLIISNQSCFAKYFQLLEVRPEFKVQSKNGNLMFNGAEWIVDRNSNGTGRGTADSYVYLLNTKYIQFYLHPKNNFVTGEWQQPINQEALVSRITVSCQLGASQRRVHGLFTTINPAL
jgi:hypothetical protein